MKKSSIIIVIVIVVAVLVAFAAWALQGDEQSADESSSSDSTASSSSNNSNSNNNSEDNSDDSDGNLMVTYDGTKFSPDTLNIFAGDTVTFRNDSSASVWPASDDHPTHTDLSGFDPKRGLEPGEEYVFTFDEPGEWGYHNHLSPSQTGVINVQ